MARAGASAAEIDAGALRHAVEAAKRRGNEAFARRAYGEAMEAYTVAIAGSESDKTLYSNRSAAALGMGLVEEALRDAAACVRADETWAKGYYRLGCALMAVFESGKAVAAFRRGLELAPESVDMKERLEEAEVLYEDERERVVAETRAARRDLAYKLRQARAEDRRTETLNSWKQSMSGPDWELEDYEWRPTFIPQMCLRKLDASLFDMDPGRLNIIAYAQALSELTAPKKALKLLEDGVRIAAYKEAIELTVADAEPGALNSALVVSAGGGHLASHHRPRRAEERDRRRTKPIFISYGETSFKIERWTVCERDDSITRSKTRQVFARGGR